MNTPSDKEIETMNTATGNSVRDQVRDAYGKIAAGEEDSCCARESCRGSGTTSVKSGYDKNELNLLPPGADMGLSCGNPAVLASLRPGEVVLDLGSGGGLDCFLAGPKVGANGRVIGVDMTAEMISRARNGIEHYRRQSGLDNVEFRLGEIEHLPVADAAVDVVISNCVLNLSPEKAQVWREIARVLKPGGRLAVSDLALLQPLPESITRMVEAMVGCVGGAVLIDQTRRMMTDAGLSDVILSPKPQYVKTMGELKDPLYRKIAEALPAGTEPSDFITSLDIVARKSG